jgi:hypothetical protein
METEGGCNQIDQRTFVADLAVAEQSCGADVAAAVAKMALPNKSSATKSCAERWSGTEPGAVATGARIILFKG